MYIVILDRKIVLIMADDQFKAVIITKGAGYTYLLVKRPRLPLQRQS